MYRTALIGVLWHLAAVFGSAQFTAGPTITLAQAPRIVRTADIVGDARPDIIVTTGQAPFVIEVLENQGAVFVPSLAQSLPVVAVDLAVGDLDADGDQDIVVAGQATGTGSTQSVLLNQGTALTRTDFVMGAAYGVRVFLEDFNGDGDLDILRGVRRLSNSGVGTFSGSSAYPGTTGAAVVVASWPGDYDGDGDIDLAVTTTSAAGGAVTIHRNNGFGGFSAVAAVGGFAPAGAAGFAQAQRLDADAADDLVCLTTGAAPELRTALGGPGGVLSAPITVATASSTANAATVWRVVSGDFNGDGDLEVLAPIARPDGSYGLTVFVNDGLGGLFRALAAAPYVATTADPDAFATADFDLDGDADLVRQITAGSPQLAVDLATGPFFAGAFQATVGDAQAASTGDAFRYPLTVEVAGPNGAALLGTPFEVSVVSGAGSIQLTTGVVPSDATGKVVLPVAAGPSFGASVVRVAPLGSTFSAAEFSLFTRQLTAENTILTAYEVRYRHERSGVPLIVAADLPGYQATYLFGTIHTTILNPLPSLAVLDGIGVFGPANPSVVTSPDYVFSFFVPAGALQGFSFVLQAYGVDLAYPAFPDYVVVSNPATLAF